MRVLVFGSSGQVAQSLLNADAPDCEVSLIGRPEGDITDKAAIEAALDKYSPDIAINAGAYTAVDKAETDQEAAFAVNRDGSANLADACKSKNIPLIHYSTDYVYSGDKSSYYVESDPTAPLGVYGASKLAGEDEIRSRWDKHIILRTAWVYSPYGGNFVKTMLRVGADRDELTVVADQFGCPTYAPDIADASLAIARQIHDGSNAYGTYHLTGQGEASWHEFATEIFRQASDVLGISCTVKPIPSSDYPTPAQRPSNSRLDGSLLDETFKLRLPEWRQSLGDCLRALGKREPN